jgi:hypothetical protein
MHTHQQASRALLTVLADALTASYSTMPALPIWARSITLSSGCGSLAILTDGFGLGFTDAYEKCNLPPATRGREAAEQSRA